MRYISLSNIDIPALGFGTWQMSGEECQSAVEQAIHTGYRHIDTAQIYENEEEVGQAIAHSGIARDNIFLTTKIWMDRVRDGDLQKSMKESLDRLKTDYVDLTLIHWPVEDVPFEETMQALEEVQKHGQTRLIGVSNFTRDQMREVVEELGCNIVNNQVEYHPYLSQRPVLDYIEERAMFLTAYSPLARGKVFEDSTLKTLAQKYDKNPGQITLRWLIQQDRVAAIPKASKSEHLVNNFDIFDFELSDEDMAQIHGLASEDGRLIDPDWAPEWDNARAA